MTGNPAAFFAVKSGSSCSSTPVSGAPFARVRPTDCSRPLRSSLSHLSRSMRMRRTTMPVPPAKAPSRIQTSCSKSGVGGAGLTVPSTCPNRFRIVVPGTSEPRARRNPGCVHRTLAKLRVSFSSMRKAWATVNGSSAATCSSRSPSLHEASRRSIPNAGRGRSQDGACIAGVDARRTNSGPNPNVTVKLAGTCASSGSESASAASPRVSRAASSVRSCMSLRKASRSMPSRRSSATRVACACGGVEMPA